MSRLSHAIALTALVLTAASPALGANLSFSSFYDANAESDFHAAAGAVQTDSFEDATSVRGVAPDYVCVPDGTPGCQSVIISRPGFTLYTNGDVRSGPLAACCDGGASATDGQRYVSHHLPLMPVFFVTVEFTVPVTAFGFNVTDFGDRSGAQFHPLYTTIDDQDNGTWLRGGPSAPLWGTPLPDGNVLFLGYVSDSPFSRFRMRFTDNGVFDSMGFDEFRFTPAAVPEPITLGLLLLGCGAVCRHRYASQSK